MRDDSVKGEEAKRRRAHETPSSTAPPQKKLNLIGKIFKLSTFLRRESASNFPVVPPLPSCLSQLSGFNPSSFIVFLGRHHGFLSLSHISLANFAACCDARSRCQPRYQSLGSRQIRSQDLCCCLRKKQAACQYRQVEHQFCSWPCSNCIQAPLVTSITER